MSLCSNKALFTVLICLEDDVFGTGAGLIPDHVGNFGRFVLGRLAAGQGDVGGEATHRGSPEICDVIINGSVGAAVVGAGQGAQAPLLALFGWWGWSFLHFALQVLSLEV